MFHSHPPNMFPPNTVHSPLESSSLLFQTDALLATLPAHPQRSRSCGSLSLHLPLESRQTIDRPRKRAVSEYPRNLASEHEGSPSFKSLISSPTATGQHSESKAGPFSPPMTSGHEQHMSQNHIQLHLGETSSPCDEYNTEAQRHSSHFSLGHHLNPTFVQLYQLEDELGSGGYGFVMTAYHRTHGYEVAVKFIIKDKVPEHAWMDDPVAGRLPAEIVLLRNILHEGIVKCLDVFEDELYFYLAQELHGSPWQKDHSLDAQPPLLQFTSSPVSSMSTPALSPSSSEASLPASGPNTPPHSFATLPPFGGGRDYSVSHGGLPKLLHAQLSVTQEYTRPECTRRASHDLFECIEQSEHKKLTEDQARYVFAQVVDAVHYLHSHGIIHRDIKDENLVIDKNLKVKLIDFGSAIAIDPTQPPPYFNMFYGTAAYASSEVLLKKSYQAAPAEIWTLGILLSYLLAGVSPFPTARDAADGRIFLSEKVVGKISDEAMDLMRRCLDPNPESRATITQVRGHHWLQCRHAHL